MVEESNGGARGDCGRPVDSKLVHFDAMGGKLKENQEKKKNFGQVQRRSNERRQGDYTEIVVGGFIAWRGFTFYFLNSFNLIGFCFEEEDIP